MSNSEKFANHYVKHLNPYQCTPQSIWKFQPQMWNEIIKLDWNESTIEPSPLVKESMEKFVRNVDFFHLYPSTYNEVLLEKLARYAKVPKINVQCFAGSDTLQEYVVKSFINPREKVILIWPSYDNFRSTCEAAGAELRFYQLDAPFVFDRDAFSEYLLMEQPKMVYICNPNNPTGAYIDKRDLEKLMQTFPNILFFIDEAYAEFAKDTANQLVLGYDNLLISHTMSKAFGLANIRFGYLIGGVSLIDFINRVRNPKNISSITQIAAEAALDDVAYMWKYVDQVLENRLWFSDRINGISSDFLKAYDSKGNFILVQCRNPYEKRKIYQSLCKQNIYVRELAQNDFMERCLRITIGTMREMKMVYEGMNKINEEMEK